MTTDYRDELISTQRKLIEEQASTIATLRQLLGQLQKAIEEAQRSRKDVQA